MRITSSYICLKGVRFHAFHGVLPQERTVGNDFVIDLRIGYPLEQSMSSDKVTDTLNYATVYEIVKREMFIPSQLIEHVAGRIIKALVEAFPAITSIDLEVTKKNPPMGADCIGASVEIHLNK